MDSNATNIELYYNQVKDNYDIDLEHFKLICNTPFKYIKRIMSSGVLKDIRIQFLGVFEVVNSRVKYSKKMVEENFNKNLISEKKYKERMKTLNNYEEC